MIKKILFTLLLGITLQLQGQSFVNDGAELMLQESALIYSTESFANKNDGQIQGDGVMDFSVARNFAVINPGVVIGDLSFNSSLSNSPDAGFMLDIQGNAGIGIENGHDHVFIDGDLVTNGVLNIATIDGFIPATTDSFTIISYTGNLSGEFANVNLGANLSNFALDYTLPGQIRLVHQTVLSIEEATIESLQVFPNPTNDIIYIRSLDKIDKVEVYNLLGKQILSTSKTDSVDLGRLAKGLYLVKVYSQDKFSVKKIKVQ
ncbi:T9SS type A sorting domain-containing protein [uncultured Kordia sp.]|uniref:T9SS type A sorting domain-containing protein n=1 Tax=uncultured Kordia sp. TaxID=507699 RepID=UPI00262C715B|nr:T9SS type A sorting domain-containing protein [uncultured Kordia sp.]